MSTNRPVISHTNKKTWADGYLAVIAACDPFSFCQFVQSISHLWILQEAVKQMWMICEIQKFNGGWDQYTKFCILYIYCLELHNATFIY